MWHINILNQKRYEQRDEYVVACFRPGDYFIDVLDELETYDLRDLKVVSYELPFELKSEGYETIKKLHEGHNLLQMLAEMEDSVHGLRFKQLCDHFFDGNVSDYLKSYNRIRLSGTQNYDQLLNELLNIGYTPYELVARFFDFKRFICDHPIYDDILSLEGDFLDLIADKIKNGEVCEYLNKDEASAYLKNTLNVLETEIGFFVDGRKLHFLEESVTLKYHYADKVIKAVSRENEAVLTAS